MEPVEDRMRGGGPRAVTGCVEGAHSPLVSARPRAGAQRCSQHGGHSGSRVEMPVLDPGRLGNHGVWEAGFPF